VPENFEVIGEEGNKTHDRTADDVEKRAMVATGGENGERDGSAAKGTAGKHNGGLLSSLIADPEKKNENKRLNTDVVQPGRRSSEPVVERARRSISYPTFTNRVSALSAADDLLPDLYVLLNDVSDADWPEELHQKEMRKRHWANPVVACVKNRCGGATGESKLKCVIQRCHKALEKDKEE